MNKLMLCFLCSLPVCNCHLLKGHHTAILPSSDGHWRINGIPVGAGSPGAGLLINVRMVNATFEDVARPDINPQEITSRFLRYLPDYIECGVRAFTLNLQGGSPGYEGAVNSAFQADGSLKEEYLQRVHRVIQACDQAQVVVILGLFYQRQDQILVDENAVKRAVINATTWIRKQGYQNVLLEIANEYPHDGYQHAIIRTPEGMAQLIRLAKSVAPNLAVSASGVGDGRCDPAVAAVADYILLHLNSTSLSDIPARIKACRSYQKPIICNEDDKTGRAGVQALQASLQSGCSWGFMNSHVNQYYPFRFQGSLDDTLVYRAMKEWAGK